MKGFEHPFVAKATSVKRAGERQRRKTKSYRKDGKDRKNLRIMSEFQNKGIQTSHPSNHTLFMPDRLLPIWQEAKKDDLIVESNDSLDSYTIDGHITSVINIYNNTISDKNLYCPADIDPEGKLLNALLLELLISIFDQYSENPELNSLDDADPSIVNIREFISEQTNS